MSARIVIPFLVFGFVTSACGAGAKNEPASPASAGSESEPTQKRSSATTHDADHKLTGPELEKAMHEGFMTSCAKRGPEMKPYCECTWSKVRAQYSSEEMVEQAGSEAYTENVKKAGAACAEPFARKNFETACQAGDARQAAYCKCTWEKLRERFSVEDLAKPGLAQQPDFVAHNAVMRKSCGHLVSEPAVREAFIRDCNKEGNLGRYCECSWKQLRKTLPANGMDDDAIEPLIPELKRVCGPLIGK